MTSPQSVEEQQRLLRSARRQLGLAIICFVVAVVCSVGLAFLRRPWWVWGIGCLLAAYFLLLTFWRFSGVRRALGRIGSEVDYGESGPAGPEEL